jgi:galactokinase/mevalonate kinase-like predicted kinase
MSVIGFSFSKFDCERKTAKVAGSIEIKHNISVKEVEKTTLNVGGSKNDVLKVIFSFDVLYGSGLGKISVQGDVVYADTKEIIEECAKQWASDKKLNTAVSEVVFKFIYGKATVKVLELADSLNLPSPIPLPKINFSNK